MKPITRVKVSRGLVLGVGFREMPSGAANPKVATENNKI